MTFDRPPAAGDPLWPHASAWLDGTDPTRPRDGAQRLRVVGVPTSAGSISPSEAWRTPAAVRAALARLSTWDPTTGHDLREELAVEDLGDWDVADLEPAPAMDRVRELASSLEAAEAVHVFLGGDNAITRPLVAGLHGPELDEVGIITLDAHHDVRHLDNGPTNGSPIRGLIEDGVSGRHVFQLGIGRFTNSGPYARWADEHEIRSITAEEIHAQGITWAVRQVIGHLPHVRTIHVDLDIDVLDQAYAPGCPGARPGGLHPHQLYTAAALLAAEPRVRSIDLVEVDASADQGGRTVMATAMTLLHVASGIAQR